MATVVFNIFLSRKNGGNLRVGETAPGVNFVRDSGASGHIRALLLCKSSSTTPTDDMDPDYDTVAQCKAQSGYSEYASATGYPVMADRPTVPQWSVASNDAQNRAEATAPSGAAGLIGFGNPDENVGLPVRYVLIYEHFDNADDTLNVPIVAIDEGTVVGTNGSAALLPMNFGWGSRVCDFLQG